MLNWDSFLTHLKAGTLAPCYVLKGDDPYLVTQAVGRLSAAFLGGASGETMRFTAPGEVDQAVRAARNFSMLSPKQIILIEKAQSIGAAHKALLGKYLEKPVAFSLLILLPEPDSRKTIPKWVLEKSTEAGLASDPGRTRKWIGQWFQRSGIALEPGVLDLIHKRCGGVFGSVVQDLEKLELCVGPGGTVSGSLVADLIPDRAEENVFNAISAVRKGDIGTAAQVLHKLLDQGEAPEQILSMFSRATKLGWAIGLPEASNVADSEIAGGLGLSTNWVARSRRFGEGLPTDVAREGWRAMREADTRIKTGSEPVSLCLLTAMVRMALAGRRARDKKQPSGHRERS